MNVGLWVEKWAKIAPKKVAIIDDGCPFTYSEVNARSNRLAHFLLQRGIRKGDRVGVLLYNCHEYIEIYVALGKIGAIIVPLNWRMANPELLPIIEDSGVRFLLFHSSFTEAAAFIREHATSTEVFVSLGDKIPAPWAVSSTEADRCSPSDPSPKDPPGPEDLHILLYSSGTTGTPKGIMLSHRKTFYNVLNADIFYELTCSDVFLVHRPLFHSGGLLVDSTPALYKGVTLIYKKRFTPRECLEAIAKYKVTIMEAATIFLSRVAEEFQQGGYSLETIKTCITGGERVPESLLRQYHSLGVPLSQIFGMSETSTSTWLSAAEAVRKIGSVGKPVFHGEVRVVDEQMKDVQPGIVGEIVVRGPILMSGYWRQPELTEKAFKDGWFCTGDLARIDSEGFIYVVDRKKDMFISGGENVYPAEVEKVLITHPNIDDAAVSGVPDEKWGEVGKAWIVLREEDACTVGEILSYLDGKIGKFKIPKHIEFVRSLPKTASGKIQRYLLSGRSAIGSNGDELIVNDK